MENCGMSLIKYILFVFNLLFAISGLGVLVSGALVLADVGEFGHFMEGRTLAPPIVLIVAGALVFIVASLGCYGAIRENSNLLIAFAVCLGIIFVIELAAGIAGCTMKGDFQESMRKSLQTSMGRYTENRDDAIAWDNVQTKLMCCGIDGPRDWVDLSANRQMPQSCCKNMTASGQPFSGECYRYYPSQPDQYYGRGCLMALKERVEGGAGVMIGVGIGIAFVQIAGIVLACWLAAVIRREKGDK